MPRIEFSEIFTDALEEVQSTGESIRLDSLTDFEWDHVIMYPEGAVVDDVEKVIGGRLTGGERYFSRINLFFIKDGKPVAGWATYINWFSGTFAELLGPDAVVESTGTHGLLLHD